MKRRIKLLPIAEDDLDSSRAWYEKQRSGLGDELVNEVEAELSRIALHPEHHPPEFRQMRRRRSNGFLTSSITAFMTMKFMSWRYSIRPEALASGDLGLELFTLL